MKKQAKISEGKCRKMSGKIKLTAQEIVLRSLSHKVSKLKFFVNKSSKYSQEVTFPIFSAGRLSSEQDELNFPNALKICPKVSSRASLNFLLVLEKFSPFVKLLSASRPDLNSSSTRFDCKNFNFQMTSYEKLNSLTDLHATGIGQHRNNGDTNYLRHTFSNTSAK